MFPAPYDRGVVHRMRMMKISSNLQRVVRVSAHVDPEVVALPFPAQVRLRRLSEQRHYGVRVVHTFLLSIFKDAQEPLSLLPFSYLVDFWNV